MKKSILILLAMLVISSTVGQVSAKSNTNNDVIKAVKLYRSANYTECYTKLSKIVEKDPTNALAYYYLAMSAAQVGKKEEAIANYDKVIALASLNSNIGRYANKGKVCIETPIACEVMSLKDKNNDSFIFGTNGANLSDEVKKQLENLKIENLKREINRKDSVEPARFKEYKDFSSMNSIEGVPSNDEIVAALRTLQRAGFNNVINNGYADVSMLSGMGQQNPLFNMLGNNNMNSQMIQAMLTNSLSQGF